MAARNFLSASERLFFQNIRSANTTTYMRQVLQYSKQTSNQKTEQEGDDLDQPVQFTKSRASEWNSFEHDTRARTNRPEYEYRVVQVPDLELVVLRQKKKDSVAAGFGFSPEDELRLKELEKELNIKK